MTPSIPKATRARTFAASAFLLATAAVYETAVALRVISLGKEPGEGPFGAGVVMLIALLALLTGLIVSLLCTLSRSTEWRSAASLVPLASAAFVAARFYTFDPYYLPTLRRMSEGGNVAGRWIAALVVIALLAVVVTKILPRIGVAMTSFVLLISAVIAVGEGIGH